MPNNVAKGVLVVIEETEEEMEAEETEAEEEEAKWGSPSEARAEQAQQWVGHTSRGAAQHRVTHGSSWSGRGPPLG